MVQFMKANIKTAKSMAMEFSNGLTAPSTKVTLNVIISRAKEVTPGAIKEIIQAHGKEIKCMVEASSNGPIDVGMKENM